MKTKSRKPSLKKVMLMKSKDEARSEYPVLYSAARGYVAAVFPREEDREVLRRLRGGDDGLKTNYSLT